MGRLPRVERRRGAGAALITIFSTFFGFFWRPWDWVEVWNVDFLSVLTSRRLRDIADFYFFIFLDASLRLRFRPAGCDWCWWYQDERNDGQILKDVLFSISEWKDRQQRKLLHQLFHRYFHNLIKSILSGLWNAFPTDLQISVFSRRRRDEEVTCYGDLGCFRDEVGLSLWFSSL